MVDWRSFLLSHKIEFTDMGANLYIHCPMCGAGDQGKHLGISSKSPWHGYGCWRNAQHRGKNAAKLVSVLLGISYAQAQGMVGDTSSGALHEDAELSSRLRSLLGVGTPVSAYVGPLEFTQDIRPLSGPVNVLHKPFIEYLKRERDYSHVQATALCKPYQLRYAMAGPFNYRLVFPVYTHDGLTTWTGRSIVDGESLRYMSLSPDPEKASVRNLPVAKAPISDCLFNELFLSNSIGRLLLIGEGPMDGMRLDFVASQGYKGVHGSCLFGKRVSDAQVDKLMFLREQYDRVAVLLDPDANLDSLYNRERLEPFGIELHHLPSDDDPGEMGFDAIEELIDMELQ